jgi:hypothetical protein
LRGNRGSEAHFGEKVDLEQWTANSLSMDSRSLRNAFSIRELR